MFYKISNTASLQTLESFLERPFKYPHLYGPQVLIDGMEEVTLPMVSMAESNLITPAIWGILPQGYKEEWQFFQQTCNSLNVSLGSMSTNLWYAKALKDRRCLIPITGFFTYYFHQGLIYPYYFYRRNHAPFCLTGLYNTTYEDFKTCSIITCHIDDVASKVHNMGQAMPMIIHEEQHGAWLQRDTDFEELKNIFDTPHNYQVLCHPIAREFFKNNVIYDSFLEPTYYKNIPSGFF